MTATILISERNLYRGFVQEEAEGMIRLVAPTVASKEGLEEADGEQHDDG